MTSKEPANISSFILAGGASSRMGRNKAFLSYMGQTFLERIAESLEGAFSERPSIVVSRSNQSEFAECEIYFRVLTDAIPDRGPISGIHVALQQSRREFTAIAAVDMPLIERSVMTELLRRLADSDKDAICINIDGAIQPLPSIFRTKPCLEELEKGLGTEELFSPLFLIRRLNTLVVDSKELPFENKVYENLNSPEDFTRLKNS
jgi:molybdopterin-guanine dinucleotide biosynthesis protein A